MEAKYSLLARKMVEGGYAPRKEYTFAPGMDVFYYDEVKSDWRIAKILVLRGSICDLQATSGLIKAVPTHFLRPYSEKWSDSKYYDFSYDSKKDEEFSKEKNPTNSVSNEKSMSTNPEPKKQLNIEKNEKNTDQSENQIVDLTLDQNNELQDRKETENDIEIVADFNSGENSEPISLHENAKLEIEPEFDIKSDEFLELKGKMLEKDSKISIVFKNDLLHRYDMTVIECKPNIIILRDEFDGLTKRYSKHLLLFNFRHESREAGPADTGQIQEEGRRLEGRGKVVPLHSAGPSECNVDQPNDHVLARVYFLRHRHGPDPDDSGWIRCRRATSRRRRGYADLAEGGDQLGVLAWAEERLDQVPRGPLHGELIPVPGRAGAPSKTLLQLDCLLYGRGLGSLLPEEPSSVRQRPVGPEKRCHAWQRKRRKRWQR